MAAQPEPPRSTWAAAALVGFLGGAYIAVSAGLIAFNKYLMSEGRFPFAVPLVVLHMFCSSVLAFLLFVAGPREILFPALADPDRKVVVDCELVLKRALPVAALFCVSLVLSNQAYLYSTVAFLQMMKEANIVLVYAFSLIAALEYFEWRQARILCCILLATFMTIHGEIRFSWTGFMVQGSCQIFEAARIVLQALMLSSAGRKLDPLTYVLLVMPLCFLILSALLLVLIFVFPNRSMAVPQWSDIAMWWPALLLNAALAFALNVIIAFFVKSSSAVAFILAGITKDAVIVLAGCMLLSEIISPLQAVGFALQLFLILLWSLLKAFPQEFEQGALSGLAAVLFGLGRSPQTAAGAAASRKGLCADQAVEAYGAVEEGPEAPRKAAAP